MISDRQLAPSVEIASPRNASEWAEAASLVQELIAWLEQTTGATAADVQPASVEELAQLQAYYVPPSGQFVIARVEDEVVGTSGVHLLEPSVAELKRVYVKPSARGLGVGSLMLEAAIWEARRLGATRLVLESHREFMATAVRMYFARGFYEIPDYTDLSTLVDGVIAMELPLVA